MLPEFDDNGNLPPGIHQATFDEVIARFGGSESLVSLKRQSVTITLRQFYDFIKDYAVGIYIDGSYVTSKLAPRDVDLAVVFPENFVFYPSIDRELARFHDSTNMHCFPYIQGLNDQELADRIRGFIEDRPWKPPKGIIYVEVRDDQE